MFPSTHQARLVSTIFQTLESCLQVCTKAQGMLLVSPACFDLNRRDIDRCQSGLSCVAPSMGCVTINKFYALQSTCKVFSISDFIMTQFPRTQDFTPTPLVEESRRAEISAPIWSKLNKTKPKNGRKHQQQKKD